MSSGENITAEQLAQARMLLRENGQLFDIATLLEVEPDELDRALWSDIGGEPLGRGPTMADIVRTTAERHGLSPSVILAKSFLRKRVGTARQEAMALCYQAEFTNGQIRRFFNLTDHTAVIHARRQYAKRLVAPA